MKKYVIRFASFILIVAMVFSCAFATASNVYAGSKRTNKKVKKVTLTNVSGKQLVLGIGKKIKLRPKVILAANSKASKKVRYSSSNSSVVSVNKKGVILGKRFGSARITVTSKADSRKKCAFQVIVQRWNQKISLIHLNWRGKVVLGMGNIDSDDIDEYDSLQFKARFTPRTATNQRLKWTSSDRSVATVTSNGLVIPKESGTTTITARATDGSGVKAKCIVEVATPEEYDDEYDEFDDDDDDDDDDDEYDDDDDDFPSDDWGD